jgi:uncharacterized protein (DUF58 family)
MIPEDLFRKIQGFHFRTRRQANELFAGGYESAFKGRGMEFAEVREYQVGDDIRAIDWNVSARFGHPYVKVFHEERELTVMLLLDISGSHAFGTRSKFKRDLLAEVAGMLAFLAVRTNDKVGAILCSQGAEKYIPPKKGAAHVWRLIKEVFTYQPRNARTDLDASFSYLNRVVKRHAIVFLISDCQDVGFEKSLRLTAKKHELSVIRISDPAEDDLPNRTVTLRDPKPRGQNTTAGSGALAPASAVEAATLAGMLKKAGVDLVDLSTNGPVVEPLLRLFEGRKRRISA